MQRYASILELDSITGEYRVIRDPVQLYPGT